MLQTLNRTRFDETILASVRKAVGQTGCFPDVAVTPETRFFDDLGFDSLDVVEMTMALEEIFDTEFSVDAIRRFQRVSDVVTYLHYHFDAGYCQEPDGHANGRAA